MNNCVGEEQAVDVVLDLEIVVVEVVAVVGKISSGMLVKL